MPHARRFRLLVALGSLVCIVLQAGFGPIVSGPALDTAGAELLSSRALSESERAITIRVAPAQRVQGPLYLEPPAPPPGALVDPPNLPAPLIDSGRVIPPAPVAETAGGRRNAPQAAGTAVVLRNSTLAPPSSSSVNEPNVGSQGDGIFMTHNWYAESSTNGGSSFSYISPYTTFPSTPAEFSAGFCCDQRVAQDSSRNLIFWYLQYIKTGSTATDTNGVRIAVAHGQAGLASNTWQPYNFTPAMFSLSGKWFDFPHLQVSANYLYFTTNIFNTVGDTFYGAMVARMPLAQLDSGAALTVDSFLTTAYGSIMAINGAAAEGTRPGRTTMYFASVNTSTTLKVLKWLEADPQPTVGDVTGLATTTFATYACAGPDGLDPCTRANSRAQTGWISDTELGIMWTSAQSGGSRPYPYTRVAILNPSTLAVISQPDIWSSTNAWLYPAIAVNERGHLGGVVDALGGSIYPTVRAIIRDDFSPDPFVSGWETIVIATSTHGTVGRWGDYNGAMPHERYPNTWLGVGHIQNGGSGNADSQPRNFWFGRERDTTPTLTVSKAGTGNGTATSSPAGIDCGLDCSESYALGTTVTLTATAGALSTFTGWSGACTGTGNCVVTMGMARAVTANFTLQTFELTVDKAGVGSGTITSSPAGINCGVDCTESYNGGTAVTLTATPSGPAAFAGWSGACSGAGGCVVMMDAAKAVTATFDLPADTIPPGVVSSERSGASPTAAATVGFTVTFSEIVSGVTSGDFALTTGGVTGATISAVAGSGATWSVSVGTGSGSGTVRLDVVDDDTIVDAAGNPLGGAGAGNGGFTGGEAYTIDRSAPTAGSLSAADITIGGGATYSFTVVFTDNVAIDVAGLDGSDIRVTGPGGFDRPAALVGSSPGGSGTPRTVTYQITAPNGAWASADNGIYTIALQANQVRDTVGNAAAAGALGTFNVSITPMPAQKVFIPVVTRAGASTLLDRKGAIQ